MVCGALGLQGVQTPELSRLLGPFGFAGVPALAARARSATLGCSNLQLEPFCLAVALEVGRSAPMAARITCSSPFGGRSASVRRSKLLLSFCSTSLGRSSWPFEHARLRWAIDCAILGSCAKKTVRELVAWVATRSTHLAHFFHSNADPGAIMHRAQTNSASCSDQVVTQAQRFRLDFSQVSSVGLSGDGDRGI